MSVDQQFVLAILAALVPLIAALGAVIIQLGHLTRQVNGRMTELVEATRAKAHAEGVIAGTPRRRPTRTVVRVPRPPRTDVPLSGEGEQP